MSQFYDQASLVMVPSGYKAGKVYSQKPLSTSGELSFSRASNATRVNSSGLVEKVRTNLQTYSQDFTNAVWVPDLVSITGGQIDPNGGTTAALVTATASSSVYFYSSSTTVGTYSIYAKAGSRSNFSILNGVYNNGASFNLATQTATASGQGSLAKIEDVGGGWFRCSVYISSASLFLIAISDISGGGMNSGDTMYFAFAQRETGDIATDYIATTSAAVSVGATANTPRLDYSGGASCPSLLLEGQRTNNALYSEQTDNAYWLKYQCSITANQAVSPDGYQNADLLTSTSNGVSVIYKTGITAGALSFFAKVGSLNANTLFAISVDGVGAASWNQDGTLNAVSGGTATDGVSYGNGWYRFNYNVTSGSVINYGLSSATSGDTAYIWGIQNEASSSYATSYIGPTLSSAVTRVADKAEKTGASALIGQTEGTIFWELEIFTAPNVGAEDILVVDNGAATNLLYISKGANNSLIGDMYVASVRQAFFQTSALSIGTHKAALAYANNNTAFFVDGVQVGTTDTSCSVPSMNRIQLGNGVLGPSLDKTAQLLVFPTRLSNADLATLTTL